MKDRAAAIASSSCLPAIERERSTATTTLFVEARFCVVRSTTRTPFSVSVGGSLEATGETSVARIVG
jgi:hypothetical protein